MRECRSRSRRDCPRADSCRAEYGLSFVGDGNTQIRWRFPIAFQLVCVLTSTSLPAACLLSADAQASPSGPTARSSALRSLPSSCLVGPLRVELCTRVSQSLIQSCSSAPRRVPSVAPQGGLPRGVARHPRPSPLGRRRGQRRGPRRVQRDRPDHPDGRRRGAGLPQDVLLAVRQAAPLASRACTLAFSHFDHDVLLTYWACTDPTRHLDPDLAGVGRHRGHHGLPARHLWPRGLRRLKGGLGQWSQHDHLHVLDVRWPNSSLLRSLARSCTMYGPQTAALLPDLLVSPTQSTNWKSGSSTVSSASSPSTASAGG